MEKTIETKKFTIELELETYTDLSGRQYTVNESLIEKKLKEVKRAIAQENKENAQICEDANKMLDFDAFKVNTKALENYGEANPETYKHFVYEYLRKYYMHVKTEGRGFNSSTFKHPYDKLSEMHVSMCDYVASKSKKRGITTVKKAILHSLCTFLSNHRQSNLHIDAKNLESFLTFTIDSGMFSFDEVIEYSDSHHLLSVYGLFDSHRNDKLTFAQLLILIILRHKFMNGLQILADKGLTSEKIDAPNQINSILAIAISSIADEYLWGKYLDISQAKHIQHKLTNALSDDESTEMRRMKKKIEILQTLIKLFPDLKITVVGEHNRGLVKPIAEYEGYNSHREDSSYKHVISSQEFGRFVLNQKHGNLKLDNDKFIVAFEDIVGKKFLKANKAKIKPVVQAIKDFAKARIDDNTGINKTYGIRGYATNEQIKCEWVTVTRFGFINGRGRAESSYKSDVETRNITITNCWTAREISDLDIALENGKTYLFLYKKTPKKKFCHVIDIETFSEDIEAFNTICKKWLDGENLSSEDIELTYKSNKMKMLAEIMAKEAEIAKMKKTLEDL